MKVLLDENLPHELRHHLPGHNAFTVAYMGWGGIKNGALLKLAGTGGFDAFLTMDNGVAYQQNTAALPVAVMILRAPSNDISESASAGACVTCAAKAAHATLDHVGAVTGDSPRKGASASPVPRGIRGFAV